MQSMRDQIKPTNPHMSLEILFFKVGWYTLPAFRKPLNKNLGRLAGVSRSISEKAVHAGR